MPPKKQIFKNTGRYTIQKKENIKKKKKKKTNLNFKKKKKKKKILSDF